MAKTRVVEIPWQIKDPKYGKYLRRRTICYVHDENNDSSLGDTVEIQESRPRSKSKRWELLRVVKAVKNKEAQSVEAVNDVPV